MKLRLCRLVLLSSLAAPGQTYSSPRQHPFPSTPEHPLPAWFVDVAAKAGITVRNVNGSVDHKRYIVESTGSGVAIIDYDADGWPDIFLVNGTELEGSPSASSSSS